jgi:invasion protein IalB
MRTRLAALSALAVMSLATAMPAAAAEQTMSCTGTLGAFSRTFTFNTDVTMDPASLPTLQGKSVTLRNGLTVTVVSANASSFTAQTILPFGVASVSCNTGTAV